ncbi:unnamed protein product [Ostreobium quekettii]|uniref:RING-CH-type domain-containing protein n=1 Tax=Ostreobium quekettii TaxID=121088 RepID=A0A8S1J8M9_9CHLO|nr:unnamed protein product [Ostreobium quekettii]
MGPSASGTEDEQALLREERPTFFQRFSQSWRGFRFGTATGGSGEGGHVDEPVSPHSEAHSPGEGPVTSPASSSSNQSSTSVFVDCVPPARNSEDEHPYAGSYPGSCRPIHEGEEQALLVEGCGREARPGSSRRTAPLPRPSSLQRAMSMILTLSRSENSDGSPPDDMGRGAAGSYSSGDDSPTSRLIREKWTGSGIRSSRGNRGMSRCSSGLPMCLICLEPLSPEDFESGEAITLECQCRGETALRHRSCAEKWVRVKGDLICDICRSPILNLPPPPPRSEGGDNSDDSEEPAGTWLSRFPGATDVFDCIRMTWVVTIVCILFFEFQIMQALFTGMVVAVLYALFCQMMKCMYSRRSEEDGSSRSAPTQGEQPANPVLMGAAVV